MIRRFLLPVLIVSLHAGPVTVATAVAGDPLVGLSEQQLAEFRKGEELFRMEWAVAPGAKGARYGLGPFYHAASCAACHPAGGRGLSPDAKEPGDSLVFRLGTGEDERIDHYGVQLSPLAVKGAEPEGQVNITWEAKPGTYADGTKYSLRVPTYSASDWQYGEVPEDLQLSPRLAPPLYGMGLLEAVPSAALQAISDPEDKDGDGISGRVNLEETWEGGEGFLETPARFGWKAWMPSLTRQVCGALGEDMGIKNMFQPDDMTLTQSEMLGELVNVKGKRGNHFEASFRDVKLLTAYVRYLAPPSPVRTAKPADKEVLTRGRELFLHDFQCAACHQPQLKTERVLDVEPLSNQTISPFTDLLLHDMGPELADGRPEAYASGSEWRTAPLWGLGSVVNDKGEGLLLHDGRARSLEEAILWHGGESEKSRDAFKAAPAGDREALLLFLRSL